MAQDKNVAQLYMELAKESITKIGKQLRGLFDHFEEGAEEVERVNKNLEESALLAQRVADQTSRAFKNMATFRKESAARGEEINRLAKTTKIEERSVIRLLEIYEELKLEAEALAAQARVTTAQQEKQADIQKQILQIERAITVEQRERASQRVRGQGGASGTRTGGFDQRSAGLRSVLGGRGGGTSRRARADARREQAELGQADPYNALLELSRVAQDAPYGLMGIANNLDRLIAQMVFFGKHSKDATTAFKNFTKGLFGSTIGALVLFNAFTSLIVSMGGFEQMMLKITDMLTGDSQAAFRRINDEITKLVGKNRDWSKSVNQLEEDYELFNKAIDATQNRLDKLSQPQGVGREIATEFRGKGVGGRPKTEEEIALEQQLERFKNLRDDTEKEIAKNKAVIITASLEDQSKVELTALKKIRKESIDIFKEIYETRLKLNENDLEAATAKFRLEQAEQVEAFEERLKVEKEKLEEWRGTSLESSQQAKVDALEVLLGITIDRTGKRFYKEVKKPIFDRIREFNRDVESVRDDSRTRRLNLIKNEYEREVELAKQAAKEKIDQANYELSDLSENTLPNREKMERALADKIISINQELYAELKQLRLDYETKALDRQSTLQSKRLEIIEQGFTEVETFEKRIEREQINRQRQQLENYQELEEIAIKLYSETLPKEEEAYYIQLFNLIVQLNEAQKEASQLRREGLQAQEDFRFTNELLKIERQRIDVENELADIQISRINNVVDRRYAQLELNKKIAEEDVQNDMEAAARKAEAEETIEARKVARLEAIHKLYLERMAAIDEAYLAALADLNKKTAWEIADASFDAFATITSSMNTISQDFNTVWTNHRMKELAALGYTQEEATDIVQEEGRARFEAMKKWQIIETIGETLLAAQAAVRNIWQHFPAPVALPLSIATAAAITAAGYARARAIGSENPPGLFDTGGGAAGGASGGPVAFAGRVNSVRTNIPFASQDQTIVVNTGEQNFAEAISALADRPVEVVISGATAAEVIKTGTVVRQRMIR